MMGAYVDDMGMFPSRNRTSQDAWLGWNNESAVIAAYTVLFIRGSAALVFTTLAKHRD